MRKRYNVGIIGLGNIASLTEQDRRAKRYYKYLTYAGTFTRHPGFNIVCASDIDRKKLKAFRQKWNIDHLYVNYKEMLNKEIIDLLIISTPPDTHASIIKYSAGKVKLILCEKPLTKGLKQVKGLINLCKEKDTCLAVNLKRNYDLSHNRLRDYIHTKNFGSIKRVSCTYGKGIFNSGSHLIAILLHFFNDVHYVQSLFQIKHAYSEFTPDVFIMFEKNIPCVIQAVDYDDYRIFEIDIFGTKERIKIEDEGLKIAHFKRMPNRSEKDTFQLRLVKQKIKPSIGEAFYHVADNMFNVLNKGILPLCDGNTYLKVEKVIEAILESSRKNGKRVYLKRKLVCRN